MTFLNAQTNCVSQTQRLQVLWQGPSRENPPPSPEHSPRQGHSLEMRSVELEDAPPADLTALQTRSQYITLQKLSCTSLCWTKRHAWFQSSWSTGASGVRKPRALRGRAGSKHTMGAQAGLEKKRPLLDTGPCILSAPAVNPAWN